VVEHSVVLSLKVYYCPNGEIIDAWQGEEKGVGISKTAAVTDGYARVAKKAAETVIPNLYARWAEKALRVKTYPLVVTDTTYAQWVKLRQHIGKSLAQDVELYWEPYDPQTASARARIEMSGEIDTFANQLKRVVQDPSLQAEVSVQNHQITVKTVGFNSLDAPRKFPPFETEITRALLIGVGSYQQDKEFKSLNWALEDVAELHKVLGQSGRCEVVSMTDHGQDKPTRENILRAIAALARNTQPEDTVLIYFSGHGFEEGDRYYLLPTDARRNHLARTAIEQEEFHSALKAIHAKRLIVLLDSCHSGGVTIGSKGEPQPDRLSELLQHFAKSEGRIIFTSCQSDEFSYEDSRLKHSVFTFYLLQALRGNADKGGDGLITFTETAEYVTDNVQFWAQAHVNRTQTPKVYMGLTVNEDILLARVSATHP